MPFTRTPNDAIAWARNFVKNVPVAALQVDACEAVSNAMYTAYPWQWTLQQISPAIALSDGVQDYSVPAELYRTQQIRITRTDVTPNEYAELDLCEWLPPQLLGSYSFRSIRKICHELTLGKYRLEAPISVAAGTTYQIDGEYQANPVRITAATLNNVFWFPDQYYGVFCDGLLYFFYKFTDDSRAGTSAMTRQGFRQYIGQLGTWHDSVMEMMKAEDAKNGDAFLWPSDSLGAGTIRSFTIFGV